MRIENHHTRITRVTLNLADIEILMTIKDISKFEHLNAVSINVYGIENGQVHFLIDNKKEKHVNVLYLQDPYNDGVGHFAWIKNLSRLVRSQFIRNFSAIGKYI